MSGNELSRWHAAGAEPRRLVFIGDSMTRAFDGAPDQPTRSWTDSLAIATSSAGVHAPAEGFQGLWRDEWKRQGRWTMSERSDEFDVAPFGWALLSSGNSGDELSWSKPADLVVNAFDLYVVDAPGAGDWGYRVDDGPWNNIGPAPPSTVNRLRRLVVPIPINEHVQIRGNNGREACVAAVAGIDVYLEGSDARGTRAHDLSAGRHFLSQFCRPTAGDPLALLDAIEPTLVVVAFSNDVLFRAPDKFERALRAIVERVAPLGDALLVGAYEQRPPRTVTDAMFTDGSRTVVSDAAKFLPSDVGEKLLCASFPEGTNAVIASVASTREATMSEASKVDCGAAELTIGFGRTVEEQARYRAVVHDVAASTDSACFDIYDAWSSIGATGWADAFEAGLMLDRYHASSLGHRDIAARLLELVGSDAR